jgi:hypothetical protein
LQIADAGAKVASSSAKEACMGGPWTIAGEYMEACSCDFLCPCLPSNATARASQDFCRFAMTFRIDAGHFGSLELGGASFAVIGESKAVMAEGGWAMGVIVDDRASDAQAEAIGAIASGRVGGPLGAFAPLVADFRGVERHPIRFEIDGIRRAVTVPGVLEQTIEGVPSASAPGECLALDNVFHPAGKRLNLAKAVKNVMACFGISWDDTSSRRNGHFAPFEWSGST